MLCHPHKNKAIIPYKNEVNKAASNRTNQLESDTKIAVSVASHSTTKSACSTIRLLAPFRYSTCTIVD